LEYDGASSVSKIINDWVMARNAAKEYIDFICLTNTGADFGSHNTKNYLGAVASGLIRHSKQNIIFVPAYFPNE